MILHEAELMNSVPLGQKVAFGLWKIHSKGWEGASWGLWDVNENVKY